MSASSERLMKLMAYADGELEGEELAEVEKLLASDADAASTVAQMGALGDFVRLEHERAVAPRVANVDLTDAIMKACEKEEIAPHTPVRGTVTSLSEARARRRKIGGAIVAALAVAASVFALTRQKEEAPLAQAPVAPAASPSAVAVASNGPGVEVEAVESAGHSVSVFYLPSANELSTSVVVWVDETGDK